MLCFWNNVSGTLNSNILPSVPIWLKLFWFLCVCVWWSNSSGIELAVLWYFLVEGKNPYTLKCQGNGVIEEIMYYLSNYSFTANVCMIFNKACKSYMFASLWKERFGKVFELFSWKRLFQCEILLWYSQVRSWLSLMSFFFILGGGRKIYAYILKLHTVIKFVWEPVTASNRISISI